MSTYAMFLSNGDYLIIVPELYVVAPSGLEARETLSYITKEVDSTADRAREVQVLAMQWACANEKSLRNFVVYRMN